MKIGISKRNMKLNGNDIALVFDMDGTIADLYGYQGWLEHIINEDTTPYEKAEPIYDMNELNALIKAFRKKGVRIAVTTWLSKDSSKDYSNLVSRAKRQWLEKHKFPYDELHIVKYGTTKANATRRHQALHQILIDDNAKVRKGWSLGSTIDATSDILKPLRELLQKLE